ncbi:hypothetical protein BDR26DRAFT_881038, partial [Obelidium mucronatum]
HLLSLPLLLSLNIFKNCVLEVLLEGKKYALVNGEIAYEDLEHLVSFKPAVMQLYHQISPWIGLHSSLLQVELPWFWIR